MNGFILFFKKEMTELVKTAKGIVCAAVFLIAAVISPVITKLTPEIIKMADLGEEFDVVMSIIPEPDSAASYSQYFENFNILGLLAVIIVFAGIVSNEKSKNTAAYILTKNISRTQFIISKFAASVVFVFFSFVLSMGTQILYTNALFSDGLIKLSDTASFSALLFLYLVFILSLTLFSSVISKNVTSATFSAFLIFIIFNFLSSVPKIGVYMPPKINNIGVLTGNININELTGNIVITILCSIVFLILSLILFKRQEL